MNILNLVVHNLDGDSTHLTFFVRRILLAGFTSRNQKLAMKHVEELRAHGVVAPKNIPSFYAIPHHLLSTETDLEVFGNETSGEIEPVLLFHSGQTYLGVGSDHTDRELEKKSIAKSKIMCRKILAPEVWNYKEVKNSWDKLVLRSWINQGRKRRIYQEDLLATFLKPEKLIRLAKGCIRGGTLDGTVLFLGTIPILGSSFGFSGNFKGELVDNVRKRQLSFKYQIRPMKWLKASDQG